MNSRASGCGSRHRAGRFRQPDCLPCGYTIRLASGTDRYSVTTRKAVRIMHGLSAIHDLAVTIVGEALDLIIQSAFLINLFIYLPKIRCLSPNCNPTRIRQFHGSIRSVNLPVDQANDILNESLRLISSLPGFSNPRCNPDPASPASLKSHTSHGVGRGPSETLSFRVS